MIKDFMSNLMASLVMIPVVVLVLCGIMAFVPGPKFETHHEYSVVCHADSKDGLFEKLSKTEVRDETHTEVNWTSDGGYSLLDFVKAELLEQVSYACSSTER